MENYDRQQYGDDFGEVRKDVFADQFDGGAVSEDAGSGDWGGGFPNWDSPQEEQQGFAEGEYDAGFVPEGEHTPGSDYDPGFVPDYELYDYPVDASAVDPWGSTQPPEYMGQARADAGDEIEIPPEHVGQAGTGIGGNETQMPAEFFGRPGAAIGENDIAMLSDDAGQAGDDAYKKFVDGLHERYPKELAEDGGLQILELNLDLHYKELSRMDYSTEKLSPAEQEIYEKHVAEIHKVEQERDSYLKATEDYHRSKREELLEKDLEEKRERAIQEDKHDVLDMLGLGDSDEGVVDHADDPVLDTGDYFGW